MEVYLFLKVVWGTITRALWVGEVDGKRHVPKTGGVIIASNHQSWFDFCFLATVLNRRLYFLISGLYYSNPVVKFALKRMDHIRIDLTKKGRAQVYDRAKEILGKGGALVVFPEGWMTFDGKIQKAYLGVARMALASRVDIVPTAIESYHIYPRHNKWPKIFRARCRIKFLEPLRYEKFKDMTPEEIVHGLLMPEIARELGHEYPGPQKRPAGVPAK